VAGGPVIEIVQEDDLVTEGQLEGGRAEPE
jgi:hypothetical protein